jgi:hypothetical protein
MTGQHLDLTTPAPLPNGVMPGRAAETSKFLGVHFACCDAYARIYPNRERTAYVGHCPRCAKRVEFPIGPGGTDARFFVAQ